MIGLGNLCDGLYRLHSSTPTSPLQAHCVSLVVHPCNLFPLHSCNSISSHATFSTIPSSAIWHFRLGHLFDQRLSMMHSMYSSISIDNKATCDICNYAKQRKLPYTLSTSEAYSKFELIHFDIWGPLSRAYLHGHKYFLTVVDDFSRFLWVILLKTKSEVSCHVKNFVKLIDTHYHITPKFIRSNNGPEFLIPEFYASKGIIHKRSCVETPQKNGRVERKHQHILNVARAVLFQSKLPKLFWSYVVLHATFLINRVPTPLLKNKSPYQKLYDTLPDINSFKVFGCLCYASTILAHRSKLQSRARKSVFLGYKSGSKGYVLFDLDTREIFLSRNVVFHELILPYVSSTHSLTSN